METLSLLHIVKMYQRNPKNFSWHLVWHEDSQPEFWISLNFSSWYNKNLKKNNRFKNVTNIYFIKK